VLEKTVYAQTLDKSIIPFDFLNRPIINDIEFDSIFNTEEEQVVLDGYIAMADKKLERLRNSLGNESTIEVTLLYTDPEDINKNQSKKIQTLPGYYITNNAEFNRRIEVRLKDIFKELLEQRIITKLTYLYRKGSKYYIETEKHHDSIYSSKKLSDAELLSLVKKLSEDVQYQTIELDTGRLISGFKRCWTTWDKIQSFGIEWRNKSVIDLGCFCGYFCFKMEEAGVSKVMGLDRDIKGLIIANAIAERKGSDCLFSQANVFEKRATIDYTCDILLVQNIILLNSALFVM